MASTTISVAGGWPAGALDAAETAFGWLSVEPHPLCVDCTGLTGLPAGPVGVGRLRRLLLSPQTPADSRDAVWAYVITRAQTGRPEWTIAAVGLALPGLCAAAGRLAAGWRGDPGDLDAELLAGFVAALRTADPDDRWLCRRLVRRAIAAGRALRHADASAATPHSDYPESRAPQRPYGHPDLLLGRAVADKVLSADDADLIGATRLEADTLAGWASAHGISVCAAASRRQRAESRLVEMIAAGRLDGLAGPAEPDPAGIG
jgi:hypothetical protein